MRFTCHVQAAFIAAVISVPIALSTARSQTLTRDPVSGDFVLSFVSHDTLQIVQQVQAADQVAPSLTVFVDSSGGLWRYRYFLSNDGSARRAIDVLQLPCPVGDAQMGFQTPRRRVGHALLSDSTFVCEFVIASTDEDVLQPGQAVDSLVVRSSRMPAIVQAKAYGAVEEPQFGAVEVHEDLSPDVARLIEQAQGTGYTTGGGKPVYSVAPMRLVTQFDTLSVGLGLIKEDLVRVCGDLAWIANQPLCENLTDRLTAAIAATNLSDWSTAASEMDTFLSLLQTNRGSAVPETAYGLLATNTRVVRARIPPP